MPTLKEATSQLNRAAVKLDTAAASQDPAAIKAAFDAFEEARERVAAALPWRESATIADFFRAIGTSVVDAQKKLDAASEEYARASLRLGSGGGEGALTGEGGEAGGAPPIATMFRIPRVSAELKFSVEKVQSKSLNVVLYSNRQDIKELHQQSVQVEVVAVPVPANYLNDLKSLPAPQPRPPTRAPRAVTFQEGTEESARSLEALAPHALAEEASAPEAFGEAAPAEEVRGAILAAWVGAIADEARRAGARELIEELDIKEHGRRSSPVKRLLLPAWERAVVVTDQRNTCFVLLALQKPKAELLIWQLIQVPAALSLLYRMPRGREARRAIARVHRTVAELGNAQARS
jgi:hypothetical protein